MNLFIRFGGVGIIAAVFGILAFIVAQVVPLFRSAEVSALPTVALHAPEGARIGMDEYGEKPFYATAQGTLVFTDAATGARETLKAALPAGDAVTAFDYNPRLQSLAYALESGNIVTVRVGYGVSYDAANKRTVTVAPKTGQPVELPGSGRIDAVYHDESAGSKLLVVRRADRVDAVRVKEKKGMGGKVKTTVGDAESLTAEGMGRPDRVLLGAGGESVVVIDDRHTVFWFYDEGEGFALRQRFTPFPGGKITAAGFLFGDMSLCFTNAAGDNTLWSLYNQKPAGGGDTKRQWGETKRLAATPGPASLYAPSHNNKAFLLVGEGRASLRHGTTAATRADLALDFPVRAAGLGVHYDLIWFLDGDGNLRRHRLHDPHPEAGLAAFFGKIWYEGAPAPAYTWQSTGSDDFEPKLSLVPLLYGTLKGTAYAMLFAVPVALLAALYTSQFIKPEVRRLVKPTIELMASLPSVVLGFIAALWLAPKVEHAVPGILLAVAAMPVAAMTFGYAWARLPKRIRNLVGQGYEFVVLVPLALLVSVAAWHLGPEFERLAFSGDFPSWWRRFGVAYEQRNCLVVGFVMGFAVIPIVYTITEDALGNVPKNLVSASLALGASRWQTAWRVVLPTASAGIFSALMIGFGRAVGETMIVVMATGNTAIAEANLFSGMRTASANIAVELPEAAEGSTHYRTLFLCACCLFLLTFAVNTLAEILRQRLREKYKVV